jgi:hypothetical protein
MEVSGQLHDPAALHPGKESPVPIVQKAGWPQNRFGRRGEEKNFASTGTRTPTPDPVASRYNDSAIPATNNDRGNVRNCCNKLKVLHSLYFAHVIKRTNN